MQIKFGLPLGQWLLLLCLLLVMIFATEELVLQEQQVARSQIVQHEANSAGQLRALIESELNIPLYLSIGLASHVQASNGNVSADELERLLEGLVPQARHVRNIGVAPGNRLTYLYPKQGNEKALGIYYPDLKEQWPQIASIIAKRKAQLVGPISLVQGGKAFIFRLPVFLNNGNDYWGIISTVIDIEPVWALVAQFATEQKVALALRTTPLGNDMPSAFYGDNSLFYDDSLLLNITLRGAQWQMALRALATPTDHSNLIRSVAYGTSALIIALLLWLLISKRHLHNSITEIERSKTYLRTVMDNVADAIVTTDPDGYIEQVNLSCYSMFGYSLSSLPGMHWSILLVEPGRADEAYSATSVSNAEFETEGRRHDGSLFPLGISRNNIILQQQPRQLLVLRDLSERQKNERLKREFISTVSHELRTPLTSIAGALSLAVGGALGQLAPPQQRLLQLAHGNSLQLSKLINALLDMEQLSNGTMAFASEPFQLYASMQKAVAQVTAQCSEKNLSIRLDCDAGLTDARVLADQKHVSQVLDELLSNACKFSPTGGEISIQLQQQQQTLRVTVTDQGQGVSAQFVPQLFSHFAQADASDSRRHGGTGLGLAICQSLVSHMHGSMGYSPNSTGGSCFYFELPRYSAAPASNSVIG